MCAAAAGKHIHGKGILGDLSGSGTACLDGQHIWRSHWHQEHLNGRAGRIVLGQSLPPGEEGGSPPVKSP